MKLRKMWQSQKRPSLLWLSHSDIKRVRDELIGLFLAPGERLSVRPPDGFFGVSKLELSSAFPPSFSWRVDTLRYQAWLKVPAHGKPYWDVQVGGTIVNQVPFNNDGVRVAALLVKRYAKHFPFLPTENYLQQGGAFIA